MKIEPNYHNSEIKIVSPQTKTLPNTTKTQVQEQAETEYAYPNSETMKAYANIKSADHIVTKEEVLNFIHSTGCQYEQRCEEYIQNMTDEDGKIKESLFKWVKGSYEKSKNLYIITGIIENSKENRKINYKVLDVLTPLIDNLQKFRSYTSYNYVNIPKYFKDKNGEFNEDLLNIINDQIKENPKILFIRPEYLTYHFLTKEKEFDIDAINYYKEQRAKNRNIKEIQSEIMAGRTNNGKFSSIKLGTYQELKPYLELWQINRVQGLLDEIKDKKSFIELAKTMKEDKDLSKIFDVIEEIKSSENDKNNLEYDRKSVEFIRELLNNSYGKNDIVTKILKTINLPMEEYTPSNIETIKNLLKNVTKPEDIDAILKAAIYKSGDKKNQFSFENLSKYIEIYKNNLSSIDEVNYISGVLSMETDDKALEVISKLYNLKWEEQGRYGNKLCRLDRRILHWVFDVSTLSINGVPRRKFLPQVLERLDKMMSMHLPMTSSGAFENFMVLQDIDTIEKLEKIRLDEIGINTAELTNGKFKSATEKELFAFKNYMLDYMKDKNNKYININLNNNMADIIEINNNVSGNITSKIMYNMTKKRPEAEMNISSGINTVIKEQKDFDKNAYTKQLFRKKDINKYEDKYEQLISQTYKQYDSNWNLKFTEEIEESQVKGVFNVKRTYPDGRVEDIVKAQKLPNGNILVEKNLTSANGTKTLYRYEDDIQGNRIMDYKIVNKAGKVLMNQSSTFEVIDQNHFISSRNNKKFDIIFDGDFLHVKDIQAGKTADINLVNFTNSTQKDIIPLLKKIPGDELFEMKEFNLKTLSLDNKLSNAAFSPDKEGIGLSEKYLDEGVLLHEWGHGKDHLAYKEINEEIVKDPLLKSIYERERKNARESLPEAILDHFSYFGADYHYLGSHRMREPIAEANMVLDVLPRHFVNSIRAHYLMQDFPEFIAKVSQLLH